jgi:hypothetical protein
MPMDIIDTRQADAAVRLSDRVDTYQQLSYALGTIDSVQDIRLDRTCGSIWSRSSSAEVKDGNPVGAATDCSEFAHLSTGYEISDHYQEPHQESRKYKGNPYSFHGVGWSAQPQPSHSWGDLNLEDYYPQDADWRAAEPVASEGESSDSQHGEWQNPSEVDSIYMNSWVTYSPPNTPSMKSLSESRDLPAQPVGMPCHPVSVLTYSPSLTTAPEVRPSDLVDTLQTKVAKDSIWTAHNPYTETIDPKDLFRALNCNNC